jgi:hypothetical protein
LNETALEAVTAPENARRVVTALGTDETTS